MAQQNPPRIWFALIDSVKGLSYKGTTADYVSLPPGSVIADFRDAVKAKHSNKLSSFDAADLLVYLNKAAFVEGKEAPLEEDTLVDSLGKSKKESLVVVVPSSTSSPELKQLDEPYGNTIIDSS